MDFSILDVFFNEQTHVSRLRELNERVAAQLQQGRIIDRSFARALESLMRENQEMRLRVGVLVRLMVEKGLITREEFAREVTEAREAVASATPPPKAKAPLAPDRPKAATPAPPKRPLPKPPKKLGAA